MKWWYYILYLLCTLQVLYYTDWCLQSSHILCLQQKKENRKNRKGPRGICFVCRGYRVPSFHPPRESVGCVLCVCCCNLLLCTCAHCCGVCSCSVRQQPWKTTSGFWFAATVSSRTSALALIITSRISFSAIYISSSHRHTDTETRDTAYRSFDSSPFDSSNIVLSTIIMHRNLSSIAIVVLRCTNRIAHSSQHVTVGTPQRTAAAVRASYAGIEPGSSIAAFISACLTFDHALSLSHCLYNTSSRKNYCCSNSFACRCCIQHSGLLLYHSCAKEQYVQQITPVYR